MKQSEICAKAQDFLAIHDLNKIYDWEMQAKTMCICFALHSVAKAIEAGGAMDRIEAYIRPFGFFRSWLISRMEPIMDKESAKDFLYMMDSKLDYSYIQCRRKELLCMIQSEFEREGN